MLKLFLKKFFFFFGKSPFFVMVHFVLPIKFVSTLAFDRAVFYGNVPLSFFSELKNGTSVF